MRTLTVVLTLALALSDIAASDSAPKVTVDLHQYGFPRATNTDSSRLGVFYLSNDRVALFFEESTTDARHDAHEFRLLVFNKVGQKIAQTTVRGNPKAIDISPGPDGGLAIGKEGQLDFYDSKLQPTKSVPLSPATAGIVFNRQYNQMVIQTIDGKSGHRTADFLSPASLEQSASLSYPINARAVLGKDELVYISTGECNRSAQIVSKSRNWQSTGNLPLCDSLTFLGSDRLAYAFDGHLYVIDAAGKQLVKVRIPAPNTFEAPAFVGLSDDTTRLAISALVKKPFAVGWPYYDELLMYDLVSKRLIFRRTLPQGPRAAALSPDGHQLASIEQGTLVLLAVP